MTPETFGYIAVACSGFAAVVSLAAALFAVYWWKKPYNQPIRDRGFIVLPRTPTELKVPNFSPPRTGFGWKMRDLSGETVSVPELARGKVVVLSVLLSDNAASRAQVKALQRLELMFLSYPKGKKICFIPLMCEDGKVSRLYAEREDLSLRLYTADGPLPPEFNYSVVPVTFVISPSGEILSRHIGAARWDDPAVVEYLLSLTE